MHQPPDVPPAAGADRDRPASCLLSLQALVDSRTNSSTAWCDAGDIDNRDSKIQITFVVADPPQVSYFCAYCTGSLFTEKPTIVHTEGNLALLYIGVAKLSIFGLDRYAFYVYHAPSVGDPSLTMLPQPIGRRITERRQIGLLPGGCYDPPHPHGHHHYHVAALLDASEPLRFELYLYSSKSQTWTVKKPVLILNEQQSSGGEFCHITSEVITVGGDHHGTMGFVDHSRGILFCNVLQEGDCPHLYYVPFPTPLHDSRLDRRDAWSVCNIAVGGGRIRFVELCPVDKTHGWKAVTWSMSAANYQDGWRQDWAIFPSQLLSGGLPLQLPRDSYWDGRGGPPLPTTWDLKGMYTGLPTLSLHDDNTLYLMISDHIGSWDRWVIAVDMANMTLQDAAHYRREHVRLRFRHSKISNHLNMGVSPGAKRYMKRPGVEVLESSTGKKQFVSSMMDDMVTSWVGKQEQHQDADDMDFDMTKLLIEP